MDVRVALERKLEHQRIDAFEPWCWRRLLRVPWTARGSNQSILKEISPECSLEGLMLKLKLQNFGYLMQRADSLERTLMLGEIEGGRRRRGQRSQAYYCPWGCKEFGHDLVTEQQQQLNEKGEWGVTADAHPT